LALDHPVDDDRWTAPSRLGTLAGMTCFDFPAAILANSAARPDHPAVICRGETLNWGDFAARADVVAATLASLGTGPGDVVAAIAASSNDYAVLWAAVLRLRATIAPLAPSSTPDQIAAMVADGRLAWRVDEQQGFENAPETLMRLFAGANRGKQVLKLD
jgi:acyl-CoA synthetase (AMP-forming)/AMP-acid ligase II